MESQPVEVRRRQGGHAQTRRDRRAQFRPCSGARRHAPTWLRSRENVHKRYLVHVAGYNLGILMRALFGAGTPREAANVRFALLVVIPAADMIAFVILAASDAETAALIVAVTCEAD